MKMKKLWCGRKRKAFSLAEILVALSIIVALGAAAFFGFNHVQSTRKIAQATQDVQTIAQACLTFESLRTNGLPSSLTIANLQTGVAAADAIDGQAHANILRMTNTKDPWNVDYVIDTANRLVQSPKVTGSHELIQASF